MGQQSSAIVAHLLIIRQQIEVQDSRLIALDPLAPELPLNVVQIA